MRLYRAGIQVLERIEREVRQLPIVVMSLRLDMNREAEANFANLRAIREGDVVGRYANARILRQIRVPVRVTDRALVRPAAEARRSRKLLVVRSGTEIERTSSQQLPIAGSS